MSGGTSSFSAAYCFSAASYDVIAASCSPLARAAAPAAAWKSPTADRAVLRHTPSKQRRLSAQCMLAPQLSYSFDFCSGLTAPACGSVAVAFESQPAAATAATATKLATS